ncbi:hypothetical protein HD554DRAFT_2133860 [Boletus coccyginus]|nr:hypothetical protein HD554DRAFT_2133860 [Boletus coccyginus]
MTMATLVAQTLLQRVRSWFGCSRCHQRLRESYRPCHLDVAFTDDNHFRSRAVLGARQSSESENDSSSGCIVHTQTRCRSTCSPCHRRNVFCSTSLYPMLQLECLPCS